VIGIILVLIAIVVAGIRHVSQQAGRHATEAQLKVCEGMLAEYKAVNGYKNIIGAFDSVVKSPFPIQLPRPWITGQYATPMFVLPPDYNKSWEETRGEQPQSALALADFKGSGSVASAYRAAGGDFGDATDFNNPRWVSNAIRWTQGVMFILLKDPKNRDLISKIPPEQILETPPPYKDTDGKVISADQPRYTIDAAVPLDAWGNPIIFVPPGGMHVLLKVDSGTDVKEYVVRTSGTYQYAPTNQVPPLGPNDRPFFASPGPDGYFADLTKPGKPADRSSDNVYSFMGQ